MRKPASRPATVLPNYLLACPPSCLLAHWPTASRDSSACAQSALWGVLSFLLWTQTFKTNLALNQLLLWVAILLWLEAACPTHPSLYRVRRHPLTHLVTACGWLAVDADAFRTRKEELSEPPAAVHKRGTGAALLCVCA